ncbi:AAA family ATPase [Winogradskyella ludwigii]|uniref:AAA family ATPase n=1 Tax=Winogradskyella ludwigii TaxID=2686076 RepID=UPI0015CADCB8|nr:AAA family ATPase [Winogradskyella ludwigii]
MINRIQFENYKAFKEGELKIKPITILLGSNSAGKSSLIQLLLMLSQTFNSNKNRLSCLQLNGELVKLGESKNIFYNKKTSSQINLNFNISVNNYSSIYHRLVDEIETLNYILDRFDKVTLSQHSKSKKNRVSEVLDFTAFDAKHADTYLSKFISLKRSINKSLGKLSEDELESIISGKHNQFRYGVRGEKELFNIKDKKLIFDFAPLKHAYYFAEALSKFEVKNIEFKYHIGYINKKKSIQVTGFEIKSMDTIILGYQYNSLRKGKLHTLRSDIFDEKILDKYSSKFGSTIDLTNIHIFDNFNRRNRMFLSKNYVVDFLLNIVRESIDSISRTLNNDNVNYINPLRAYPRRYYFQDEVIASTSTQSLDTIHLIELFRERPDIKKSVNSWMKKFNINVDITQLEEVIHKIKVNHSGLSLDITDVGFGISQVMPIITQCYLAKKNSITLIEQPEIHLHPKMQADLADLFIESCSTENDKKNFIIETHSEYLLKRLRRRVSEGKISSSDIGLYFIHGKTSKENFARIEEIEINKTGDFTWPKDFYEFDLLDTVEFLKNQQ